MRANFQNEFNAKIKLLITILVVEIELQEGKKTII